MANKWNYEECNYEPIELPDGCAVISERLSDIVTCCQCHRKVRWGDCYTSKEIRTDMDFGYSVCPECYDEECIREAEAKKRSTE